MARTETIINKKKKVKYPGKRVTADGNTLVATTEAMMVEAGVFYPITPSTQMGEYFQNFYAKGQLNAFGKSLTAIETEGEHAAQGGAIAMSVTGKRTVNFTSGQGIVYGLEQYYHAPGKLSTMTLEVGSRALTKHALNVHCGHDDTYAAMDTGWTMLFAKTAQQAVDQSIIIRRVNELTLNPGMNIQDGFLTTHLERTFRMPEAALIREFLGAPDDLIDCPTEAQRVLFGPQRRRVPKGIDLKNPILLGPVQNQEHYMNGVAARRNNFLDDVLPFLEQAYKEYGELTGRYYGLVSEYNCRDADTVFVALGSAAENMEAVSDYIKETRGENLGVIHINVLRPFPEAAVIEAIRGKKQVIILERTDEPLAADNPFTRDIKSALSKAVTNYYANAHASVGKINPAEEMPDIFSGVYGLGSRDFRPEDIIGAYDFALNRIARQDGKKASDGVRFFYCGIDHPYTAQSKETPSCLPNHSIAVRFHSIGGWGMITTGKNLGSILGELSNYVAERDDLVDENGERREVVNISANPKYGSEKKGAPTNYFLVAAPDRVRVNCDLRHVNVVLCCDPKIFLHTNPLNGLREGGAFVWESNEKDPARAWLRIPKKYRQEIIDKKIRIFILDGFDIAKAATEREDLQTRMQGNSFLGAFFQVSPFLQDYNIPEEEFLETVEQQYRKKFGRFGDDVVASNMKVMHEGFSRVREVQHGKVDDEDLSHFIGQVIAPCEVTLPGTPENGKSNGTVIEEKAPLYQMKTFDAEFRAGLGYDQPSSVLSSVGLMAAGTGATASKYVSRREIPIFIDENCTQCMDCITVCPDTALPNTAQDVSTILSTAIRHYVSDKNARKLLLSKVESIESGARAEMVTWANEKSLDPDAKKSARFPILIAQQLDQLNDDAIGEDSIRELKNILDQLPLAYLDTNGIFKNREKKQEGAGGIFSIFVQDLCKGCAACVEACGSHEALKMVPETEELHAKVQTATTFMKLLRDTPDKYLGIYDPQSPAESKAAALKFHLMQQSKYNAMVSGDGACAGCGEKSALRALATVTEALMRPIFHNKAKRLRDKAAQIDVNGADQLKQLKKNNEQAYNIFRRLVLHKVMGFAGEDTGATEKIIENGFKGSDSDLLQALARALRHDADQHDTVQFFEGFAPNGMSAMAMAAHTGCNTVYGSTPPNNPHPYPWMNSLFQDGATIGWLMGESFIADHATLSVIPERLADGILEMTAEAFDEDTHFRYTHFSDSYMTDDEVLELPKVWVVGGDGGMGDIGFQNVSKVILQNRPNVKMMMLDTQVYSNTGGQNSDSSPLPGGGDFNQFGVASQGKITEMKSVSECFINGHGSPYVAQVSMANAGTFYKALVDGICYRGTAYYQVYTTCQPEHGVADHLSQVQAQLVRDSRGLPEFVFNPQLGETYQEALYVKGNPNYNQDWFERRHPATKKRYTFTVAHWAVTEPRFRRHFKKIKEEGIKDLTRLEDILPFITMDDIVHRRYLDQNHRAFIPDFGVYMVDYDDAGEPIYQLLSRQLVIFCVERRKAWRLLQSRAGVENKDYMGQKEMLKDFAESGKSRAEYLEDQIETS